MSSVLLMVSLLADGLVLGITQAAIIKRNIKTLGDNFLYLSIVFFFGSLVMAVFGGRFATTSYTVMLGLITGVLIIIEAASYVLALRNGPMSLTSMISMSAMVIPMIPAGLLWDEPMTPLQIAAAILMLFSIGMILEIPEKRRSGDLLAGVNKKWLLFCFVSFLAGGCMGFPQKYQSTSPLAGDTMSYLLWSFMTAVVVCIPCILIAKKAGEKPELKLRGSLSIRIAACGVMTALLHILTMKCMEVLPISVVLPVSNGGRLILFTIFDMVYFKQKLSRLQLIGIGGGVLAILLLSI